MLRAEWIRSVESRGRNKAAGCAWRRKGEKKKKKGQEKGFGKNPNLENPQNLKGTFLKLIKKDL
jgi:hypothetical protein